ncbi:tetratricopeptide repeat protein [Terricaulis silvestris]|uniref:Zn-dependent protease n=1 Tax=Terricaulis silvestris TaxID=2686094 RepID=A0A6I6MJW9_9CAUL|nr:tetratricopeptide repeat protein [Terricaulis silvestris]QGZ95500.1 Putative Zn-dependent protease [Terricaulis silvestris]
MTNDSDSFIQEVDESLRQDRMLDLVKRWGPWLIGAFVLLLAGVLAWQAWQAFSIDQGRAHAGEYAAAQALAREGNFEEAKIAFDRLSNEGPRNYRVMAQMELGAVLEAQGDLQASLAAFDEAAEAANDPVMRETAQLRAAYIVAETQDFAALQTRLTPLIESESRLSFLARELLALEAWEAGNNDLARDQLENLTLAFDAPEAVRQRAQVALSVIGPAPTAPADGAPAPAPSEGETK